MGSILTDAVVRQLPKPATGNRIVYDSKVPGFGARVTANGAIAFVLNYRARGTGRERRITIGKFASWNTTTARAEATRLRRLIDQGEDPLGTLQDERGAPTMADLLKRFDAEHIEPRLRPGTQKHYRSAIRRHIAPHFGAHTKVEDVRFDDVDALHRKTSKVAGTFAANRVAAILSRAFASAVRWGWCATNPARGVQRNSETKRQRYLNPAEMAALTAALAAHHDQKVADIIRLLLLTGARKGEVLSMRWSDIDLKGGTWSKSAAMTKQRREHHVPLSAPARAVLAKRLAEQAGGAFVFPGDRNGGNGGHITDITRPWEKVCKAAGLKDLRLHDLRHSFASELVSSGASLPLIGALLGHSNPTTTARYSHLYDSPLKAAVERVGAVIANAGKDNTVAPVPLPNRKGGRP
jgi:integrase